MIVPVGEAKSTLSRLLVRAEAGDDVVISRSGVPVARLVPVGPDTRRRRGGFLAGQIVIGSDFDDPLPVGVEAAFDGRGDESLPPPS